MRITGEISRKKFGVIFILLAAFFILTQCNEPSSVQEDVDEYCQCMKERKGQNRRRSRQCRKLKKTIRKKFEHDNKALEYLQEHQYDCIENW
ncbi:MAG: putative small secreted protein [Crocinitomicaceae bacterium]|jgi:predicted small secreted protein